MMMMNVIARVFHVSMESPFVTVIVDSSDIAIRLNK